MTTKTLEFFNIEQKIFWILFWLLALALSFYLYSVVMLSLAVVDRNTTNAKVHELAIAAGTLEADYLAQTNSITLAYAQKLGFREVNPKYTGTSAKGGANAKLSIAR